MLTYADYRTPAEFETGYANNIDAAVVERWEAFFRERSAEIADRPRLELAYGPHARNRIDFFPAPGAPTDAPLLVAIHGGLWFLFDRWMMHFLVPAFTAAESTSPVRTIASLRQPGLAISSTIVVAPSRSCI